VIGLRIVSLSIGKPKKLSVDGNEYTSGVGKERVESVFLKKEGFQGDGVEQTKFHGGPDRAVLFYCFEHYQKWKEEFGKELVVPGFGENLTVSGLSEENVHIGDIYQIGETLVQISQSRIPCNTLSKYNDEQTLLSRLVSTGYTGFLARVLQEGWIYADSEMTLVERKENSVSVFYSNEIYFHDQNNIEGIKKLLKIEELAGEWRNRLKKRLAQIESKS
jgi:MOSC domain-containing protein YiiM